MLGEVVMEQVAVQRSVDLTWTTCEVRTPWNTTHNREIMQCFRHMAISCVALPGP